MGANRIPIEGVLGHPIGVKWTIRLLGRLEVVSSSEKAVRFPSRTALSLLAYLSLNRAREVSNDELHGLFWPESEGDKQAQNLRRAISDLRKVLERDLPLCSVIVTRRGHVSLNPDRVVTDVERFLDLTRHSEEHQTKLAEAIDLYAGPLLAPLSDSWLMGRRMELEERYGQAVERFCEILVEQGSVKEAINIGRAAVVAAPSREDVHIALIQAYRRAGMGVEALRQFEELERILDETWGETPSAKAREALEAAFEPYVPPNHNLPEQLTSFIGREKKIEEVCELLTKTRLLTLTGSGGCGKTRLSLQVAGRMLDQFRDGVWFVEFASLADPGLVPNTVAAALGLSEQPGKPIEQTVVDYLKAKQLLLVLDNCEHLLLACAQLAEAVLRQCPSVVVLANSREGLAIGGELVYRVPSLSLPNPKDPQTPESLAHYESVQLFVERAVQVQRAFSVTDQNAAALASVCQRLDGIPLAIELAAARLRSLSVEEVNQRLDQRFRLLTGGSRTALPRQQTLRSLIDWSYDLLNESEKGLLCRLAVFAGGWTLESAKQVCAGDPVGEGEVLDLLTSLCDKNLVVAEQEDGNTRYRMLETIRQYARDRLLESGASEECRDRHLNHFLVLAEEAEPHLVGLGQREWLERLESEHDNLRAALEWSSAANGALVVGLRLAGAISRFWFVRCHLAEGRVWLSGLLAANLGDRAAAARAKALNGAGGLAYRTKDYPSAKAMFEESLAISRMLGDRWSVAVSLNGLGIVAMDEGEFAVAKGFFEESLNIKRKLGDWLGISTSLNNLGTAAFAQGDFFGAHELAKESLEISRDLGHRWGIARAVSTLGKVAFEQKDYSASLAFFQESLVIYRELGDKRFVAFSLRGQSEAAFELGDYSAARALCLEGLAIGRELGDRSLIVCMMLHLASVHIALGHPNLAVRLWGAAEPLREDLGDLLTPNERERYDQQMAAARAAIGDDEAFDRAWQEGRAMTIDQAIELTLAHESDDA